MVNETKSCYFEKMNKIDKTLTRLIKKKKKKKKKGAQINKNK